MIFNICRFNVWLRLFRHKRIVAAARGVAFSLLAGCAAHTMAQDGSLPPGFSADAPAAQSTSESRRAYTRFAMENPGDAALGLRVFTNVQAAACIRCHTTDASSGKAGPDLFAIADKFPREELIKSILEPSATIAIGYDTTVLEIDGDEEYQGIIKQATEDWTELMGWDGLVTRYANADITARRTSLSSFMPAGLETVMSPRDFANLVAYLQTLHQQSTSGPSGAGLSEEIPLAANPVVLEPFVGADLRLDRPTWFGQMPNRTNCFVVLEVGGRSWVIERTQAGFAKRSLVDLSGEVFARGGTGLLGFAFHPDFAKNRRYFLKHQIRDRGEIYTRLVERKFSRDFRGDSGEPGREILRIRSVTQDHNGGCIEFGPDGYLYLGMGDTGPQGDPQGHGQDLGTMLAKMLRLDVDHTSDGRQYAIPASNPFVNQAGALPEIWAYGLREPWRFSFDPANGDLWVGDVGQNQFEEVDIVRRGENYGWNVIEGFAKHSDRYRKAGADYVPPVFSYSRRFGVSLTGGYVYRGRLAPQMDGQYIFGDFESRRIWALTQTNRQLQTVVEIGRAPTRLVSFGKDNQGELYVVGYDNGIIYRMDLSVVDPTPLETRVIAETSETVPVRWRYTVQRPPEDWSQPKFNDAAWNYGPGGFGTRGTSGAIVRTEWNTQDIWLRREFVVNSEVDLSNANSLALRFHHDDDAEIYLNGVLAARLPQWTWDYNEINLSPEAARTLRPGRNLLAIHCRQLAGGQYIDAGLIERVRKKK